MLRGRDGLIREDAMNVLLCDRGWGCRGGQNGFFSCHLAAPMPTSFSNVMLWLLLLAINSWSFVEFKEQCAIFRQKLTFRNAAWCKKMRNTLRLKCLITGYKAQNNCTSCNKISLFNIHAQPCHQQGKKRAPPQIHQWLNNLCLSWKFSLTWLDVNPVMRYQGQLVSKKETVPPPPLLLNIGLL